MEKIEYRTFVYQAQQSWFGVNVCEDEFGAELNKLGDEGWELVSSAPLAPGASNTVRLVLIFKRKVS
ncbi:MAG: DUF4177 domain-containing protein [Defluviitaleaceae bacterium]|nr:DUF4177 domain-containing protein [Defluviitaleaceae bacterium]